MNIQIVSPYRKCPFNCPMCIAAKEDSNGYANLYQENEQVYFETLNTILNRTEYKTAVLTGDTEPTLFNEWINKMVAFLLVRDISIELQTKNYGYGYAPNRAIDIIAYSIPTLKDYYKFLQPLQVFPQKARAVILLTKEILPVLTFSNLKSLPVAQLTFKVLQYGEGESQNEWASKNTLNCQDMEYIEKLSERLKKEFSVKIDRNCMDSRNRYRIFQIDGKLREKW